MRPLLDHFADAWIVIAKVMTRSGERAQPIAFVAQDIERGSLIEIGVPKLLGVRHPPYPTGPQAAICTVDAHELAAFHLALGWRMPERIIDLMIEFKLVSAGRRPLVGGLVGALLWFGRRSTGALSSGSAPARMRARLAAVAELLHAMTASLDVGRALLRGRYMCAVARIEATGIPIDGPLARKLANDWPAVRHRVIQIIDRDFGVIRGHRLDIEAFAGMLDARRIDWPKRATGHLDLTDDTFREMTLLHPELRPLKELLATQNSFDPSTLAIGSDGRNRTPLRPFASLTGRNQPSAKASVLGSAAWVRHLIEPAAGKGLALIDWAQQEFGIAAALSGDTAMQAAYLSGDPYLAMAKAAGAVPGDATADTHPSERERFKACALGVQYGIGRARLARQLGLGESAAQALMDAHRRGFPRFWTWIEAVEANASLYREQLSVFGWRRAVEPDTRTTSLRNFPMQANGAEMLRLACCLVTEAGIAVCAPNHDAILIEAPLGDLDAAIADAQRLMAEASAIVLDGLALRTAVKAVRWPDRWSDERGRSVWRAVRSAVGRDTLPAHQRDAT